MKAAGFDAGFFTLASFALAGLAYFAVAMPETLDRVEPARPDAIPGTLAGG